jgi:3-hydroxybutyryl-CoA dehydrogenase
MKIAVRCTEDQKQEWLQKAISPHVEVVFTESNINEFINTPADAYFDLIADEATSIHNKPVFINAVITTCLSFPENYIRINAWNGFLQRETIEIATIHQQKAAKEILDNLGLKYVTAPDTPGMITARIIAMIINEAYFALGDKVSSKKEIDTAMKLGTNYPFGPFEWSEKIGLQNIAALLKALNETSPRYELAPQLIEEANISSR